MCLWSPCTRNAFPTSNSGPHKASTITNHMHTIGRTVKVLPQANLTIQPLFCFTKREAHLLSWANQFNFYSNCDFCSKSLLNQDKFVPFLHSWIWSSCLLNQTNSFLHSNASIFPWQLRLTHSLVELGLERRSFHRTSKFQETFHWLTCDQDR